MGDADEFERQMAEVSAVLARQEPHPYRDLVVRLMWAVAEVGDLADEIGARWHAEHLTAAKPPGQLVPPGYDFDGYARPLIVVAEMLRKQVAFKGLAHRIYEVAVRLTDRHCADTGTDLHRGALYADLAITYFERGQYELGLSWLLAAANEDLRFGRVTTIYDSFGLSDDGIFGQWVQGHLLPAVPAAVLDFVNGQLGTAYSFPDVMRCLRAFAGHGDLNLLAGVMNFAAMEGRTDYLAHSVRFTCLRDLATLVEVLLKRVGAGHTDPAVQAEFADGPMLACIIHHMHYQYKPGQRSADPTLKAAKAAGLFWNSSHQRGDLLTGIDVGFATVKDFAGTTIAAVKTYLDTHTLVAGKTSEDELAKRVLLAYRLRNDTSHGIRPTDPGMVAHAAWFRTVLLQMVFYTYFHFCDSGQSTL